MELPGGSQLQIRTRPVRLLWILVAITAVLSLLYAIQYYAGGPLRLPVASEIYDLALSPDRTLVAAAADDGKVRLWPIPQGFSSSIPGGFDVRQDASWEMRTLSGHSVPVIGIAFGSDGSTLTSVDKSGEIRVWDVASGRQVGQEFDAGTSPLSDAAFTGDGALLAVAGEDGMVRVWDLAAGREIRSFGTNGNPRLAVTLNADGTLVAAGDGTNIQVWDVGSGELVRSLVGYCEDQAAPTPDACEDAGQTWLGHEKEVTALAFSPDGQLLASGSADTSIVYWQLETSAVAWTSEGPRATVTTMVFNQEGDGLLAAGRDSRIRTFRVPGGKITATYEGHLSAVNDVAYGPLPDTILSCGKDGTLRVWEMANQYGIHLEWPRRGLQATWGAVLAVWMLISGILAAICLYGLWRFRIWSHLLTLALFLLGPTVVLGLPLMEAFPYYYIGLLFRVFILLLAGVLALAAPLASLGSLVCFVLVLIKLFQNEGVLRGIGGILVFPYAFVWGWLKAKRLRIDRTMLAWTGMFVVGVVTWLLLIIFRGFWLDTIIPDVGGYLTGTAAGISGDLAPAAQLGLVAPLLVLGVWYAGIVFVAMQEKVAADYTAPRSAPLADQLMVSQRTGKIRLGILGLTVWLALLVILYSVLRRFNLDIAFMGSFLEFIMLGSGITFYVSALSILLAVVLAMLGALGRLSTNPIPNGISSFYISLIRGTPLLVQIYIWYLGLARLDIVLDPRLAGILALGVNYGAYMTEIFRAGIQAVSIGQREAAHALGMSTFQTFRRIILPQAFRIVIPPIGNEFIAMMKDSSLVSVITVQELTWRASKIGRQYFRNMETFIIAAAFYWILTVIFQMFQGRLEEYMARGERR